MSNTLVLPWGTRPTNLHLPPGAEAIPVDDDLFDICARIREIDETLHVVLLSRDDDWSFAIMESCWDGTERLVFKVKELDGRVLDRLRRLMALTLAERIDKAEKDEFKFKEEDKEFQLEELYDRVGRPMWTQLEHDGFIQRPVSFPKAGHVGGKGSAKRAK